MKQVIVVRKDLTMRKGKLAAQVGHACVKSVIDNELDERIEYWLKDGMSKIVVGCNSLDELFQLIGKARELNVMDSLIKDAGLTEFKQPTYTCVAIGPDEDELVDQVTGHLKLL